MRRCALLDNQPSLSLEAPPSKRSKLDTMAGYFLRHEGELVSALTLMQIGGALAWRTRVSDCRRLLGMNIENELRRQPDGTQQSWYRYRRATAA